MESIAVSSVVGESSGSVSDKMSFAGRDGRELVVCSLMRWLRLMDMVLKLIIVGDVAGDVKKLNKNLFHSSCFRSTYIITVCMSFKCVSFKVVDISRFCVYLSM